ncbi:cobalamin-binding protein [Uliginosibacterium sp. H3]|uniref:Cobalamin-binding protein n=1 Tax=Uliginosibacterium silvisoli TaxID=3114758 RepID=A0ABU6JXZ4_9RHOO|nr:cobalamin-binding protein [Uliginosibacterium sp. H3]
MQQKAFHVFLTVVCVFFTSAAYAAPVKDDAGRTLDLPRPAMRVMTLAPSLTEMLYEAGGGDKLIGTVEYSNYPPAAQKVERVGSNQKLDLERIAALKPDVVLVWYHGNALREIERVGALGIPLFYVEPHTIADIPGVLERLGQLVGTDKVAQEAAQRFRNRHAALRTQYSNRGPINVFYQISGKPLMTMNDEQIISDVIRLCGGRNVFGKEPMLVPRLSTESVVAIDPDVIMASRLGYGDGGAVRDPDAVNVKSWNEFTGMKAVRNKQIWLIPGDQISRHGPRILDAAQAVCTALDEARKFK